MKFISSLFLLIVLGLFSCQQKFDKIKWQTQEDPAFPPQSRDLMLKDLLSNHKLINMDRFELLELLGEPENSDDTTLEYKIVEDYASDIDPVYTKTLKIQLTQNKKVKKIEVVEWKE